MPDSNGEPPSPVERERIAESSTALEKAVARRRRATAAPASRRAAWSSCSGRREEPARPWSHRVSRSPWPSPERTWCWDLDLQFGDAALTLGLPPTRTIYDLVNSGGSLDAEKLADYLVTHESGVKVLRAPARRTRPPASPSASFASCSTYSGRPSTGSWWTARPASHPR